VLRIINELLSVKKIHLHSQLGFRRTGAVRLLPLRSGHEVLYHCAKGRGQLRFLHERKGMGAVQINASKLSTALSVNCQNQCQ